LGVSNTWMTLGFDDQQLGSLEFQDVQVIPNAPARSGSAMAWTDGFTLQFRMAFSGFNSPDEQFPLFHLDWMSDWNSQVATDVAVLPTGPEAEGALQLTAVPGVTRAGTVFRFSRPFRGPGSVRILDVAGRVVRGLPVEAGAREVPWDGRSGTGQSAATGVYFAVPEDGASGVRGGGTTKVVRLR
ncbi:MAG: hypothetical protein HKN12_11455, partial [Gemmatimonadetes bacterium]|nr:hypothetical protein [Gemmatimonadota bacterium]